MSPTTLAAEAQCNSAKVSQGHFELWHAAFEEAGLISASKCIAAKASQKLNSLSEDCVDGRLPDH